MHCLQYHPGAWHLPSGGAGSPRPGKCSCAPGMTLVCIIPLSTISDALCLHGMRLPPCRCSRAQCSHSRAPHSSALVCLLLMLMLMLTLMRCFLLFQCSEVGSDAEPTADAAPTSMAAVSYVYPVVFHWLAYYQRARYQKEKVEAEQDFDRLATDLEMASKFSLAFKKDSVAASLRRASSSKPVSPTPGKDITPNRSGEMDAVPAPAGSVEVAQAGSSLGQAAAVDPGEEQQRRERVLKEMSQHPSPFDSSKQLVATSQPDLDDELPTIPGTHEFVGYCGSQRCHLDAYTVCLVCTLATPAHHQKKCHG